MKRTVELSTLLEAAMHATADQPRLANTHWPKTRTSHRNVLLMRFMPGPIAGTVPFKERAKHRSR
jgi:hypothetical protein